MTRAARAGEMDDSPTMRAAIEKLMKAVSLMMEIIDTDK